MMYEKKTSFFCFQVIHCVPLPQNQKSKNMFRHNLKIAFRNLRKYKTQNIISIIGLAVGFVCFAFSALWIRYEMSYDSFHANADRIYRVNTNLFKWDTHGANVSEIQSGTPYPLADWLKSNYPEIEAACAIRLTKHEPLLLLYLDQNFTKVFDIILPEDFFFQGRSDRPIAVTQMFNNEATVQHVKNQFDWDVHIATIFEGWSANTNIQFNTAIPIFSVWDNEEQLNSWTWNRPFETFILIHNNVDIKAFKEKLDKVTVPESQTPISIILTAITDLRYDDPTGNIQSEIKFAHIKIFAVVGLLVILCSLFNHLVLHVTRVRMRLRELALRKVNGASNFQIATTLYSDFMLVIILSLVVGFMIMTLLLPTFKDYTNIVNTNISIYAELIVYALLLITCCFLVGGIQVLYYRKQSLNDCIKGQGNPGSRNRFCKGSLFVQLSISLGMMFCAIVFIKQINFLKDTDLGINRRNVSAVQVSCCSLPPHYANLIKQVPGIIDALPITTINFLKNMTPAGVGSHNIITDEENVSYSLFMLYADSHFFDFFGVEIIDGIGFANDINSNIVYNETAMKEIGEILKTRNFLGVVQDFYLTPTTKSKPIAIRYLVPQIFRAIAYRYEDGTRQKTEESVAKWLREEFPDQGEFEIDFAYMEDIFEEYFKSERALFKLLSFMTLACILIAVFGVYSLTSLSCQQRRKEIAIRKVYGAEVLDIMNTFFKEYLILLAMAALVAFPTGYIIMKRWLEGYVKQTSMDAWLYVGIFLIVFAVIVFSIFSMVWKAANQNPAEVVKSE